MWKIAKKVLQAAVAQPWDYVGEGAPDDWEFRVEPGERFFAVYAPAEDAWIIYDRKKWVMVARVESLAEMDRNTEDWRQFLSVEDPDEE